MASVECHEMWCINCLSQVVNLEGLTVTVNFTNREKLVDDTTSFST